MVTKWRRAVARAHSTVRDTALEEIREFANESAIPTLEAVTLGRDASHKRKSQGLREDQLGLRGSALGGMRAHTATESLVRHAVLSPSADVRTSAAEKLKCRPMHEYVPLLAERAGDADRIVVQRNDRPPWLRALSSLALSRRGGRRLVARRELQRHAALVFPDRDYVYRMRTKVLEDHTESRTRRAAKMAAVARNSHGEFGRALRPSNRR